MQAPFGSTGARESFGLNAPASPAVNSRSRAASVALVGAHGSEPDRSVTASAGWRSPRLEASAGSPLLGDYVTLEMLDFLARSLAGQRLVLMGTAH